MPHGGPTGERNWTDPRTAAAPKPPPPDAPAHEHETHWLRHVYQGDSMPQLTIRAVLMGGVLGMLMSISNLYTVLKVGWLFGVAITACVMSFVIWNLLRVFSFGRLSRMSILENACMASTASAAGYSTGSTIGTMFGAVLILEGEKAGGDIQTADAMNWWVVLIFTLCTGALGVFLGIPMKRQMINVERLPFPSGIAAAATLKSLYSEGKEAVRQAYVLITGLVSGVVIGVLNTPNGMFTGAAKTPEQVPGWLRTIDDKGFGHLPELVPEHGLMQLNSAGQLVNALAPDGAVDPTKGKMLQGFGFEPSGLLIAAGMIVGLRSCLSMLAASILLYFFVIPNLVAIDAAQAGAAGHLQSVTTNGAGTVFRVNVWSLWGGTAVMVVSSLTALALQWRTVARSFNIFKSGPREPGGIDDVEVPMRWFIVGMVPITIAMVAVGVIAFHITWYWGLVAVGLSFVLALVAARATGETDTTPIGAMGKVMQLVFGAVQPGQIMPNLASAGITANGASACADLLTDLKTGYILGANPRKQFIAQFCGIFFGSAAIVPAWYLMVPSKAVLETYPLPSTQQWVAVAKLLSQGVEFLPHSARWAIVIGALVGLVLPIAERLAPKKLRPYMPSAMGFGLSWIMPFCNALAFAMGAVITWIWTMLSRRTADRYNVAVASGLIAGEGLIKAIIAMSATVIGLLAAGAATAP